MRINIMLIALLFLAILFSSTSKSLRDFGVFASVPGADEKEEERIRVDLNLLKAQRDNVRVEISTHNLGGSPIWIMTNPKRSDSSRGFYVGVSETDQTLLELSARLYYGPNNYDLSKNSAGVTLALLRPNQKRVVKYNIKFPMEETMPPYGDTPMRKLFDLDQIKYVRSCVGTLPDNQSVREAGKRKYSPYHVNGLEQVDIPPMKNVYLFQAQKVVCSPKVELQNVRK